MVHTDHGPIVFLPYSLFLCRSTLESPETFNSSGTFVVPAGVSQSNGWMTWVKVVMEVREHRMELVVVVVVVPIPDRQFLASKAIHTPIL